ncbi:MAG: Asd/ArgC dimerization domain-containing protein [Brevinemataceae bacterium]
MPCKVAIIGVESIVGRELVRVLEEQVFPLTDLHLFESEKGIGNTILFNNKNLIIEELSEHVLKEGRFKFVFFAGFSDKDVREYASIALESGAVVIDHTSYFFTKQHQVPVIAPPINSKELKKESVIAVVPNSIAFQASMCLAPIQEKCSILDINISALCAVSEFGDEGVADLENQIDSIFYGKEPGSLVFPYQIAYNVIPYMDSVDNNENEIENTASEQLKMLLDQPDMEITVNSMIVPVIRGNCLNIVFEVDGDLSEEEVLELWKENDLLSVNEGDFSPWNAEGSYKILIGKFRKVSQKRNKFYFCCSADNILMNKVSTMLSIAEQLMKLR